VPPEAVYDFDSAARSASGWQASAPCREGNSVYSRNGNIGFAGCTGEADTLCGDPAPIDCWFRISGARPGEMVQGPEVFAGILQATGVPLPHLMAWVTISTEIVCGVSFLIGAFVPLVSIPAIILLAVAILTVHLPYGFSSIKLVSVNNRRAQFGPPGYECDLLYIACILALVLIGPTLGSVDKYRSLYSQPKSLNI
jgi:putative oxidoreductase